MRNRKNLVFWNSEADTAKAADRNKHHNNVRFQVRAADETWPCGWLYQDMDTNEYHDANGQMTAALERTLKEEYIEIDGSYRHGYLP